jgi:hypothetical protein
MSITLVTLRTSFEKVVAMRSRALLDQARSAGSARRAASLALAWARTRRSLDAADQRVT